MFWCPKTTFTDSRCSGKLSHSSNCFSPLQTLIPWSPPCLCCVSGIHRERNHSSTRSTRPITVHERTAICKSQLEPIIENPGNTRGAEQAFGRWFADRLFSPATQARPRWPDIHRVYFFWRFREGHGVLCTDCCYSKVTSRLNELNVLNPPSLEVPGSVWTCQSSLRHKV